MCNCACVCLHVWWVHVALCVCVCVCVCACACACAHVCVVCVCARARVCVCGICFPPGETNAILAMPCLISGVHVRLWMPTPSSMRHVTAHLQGASPTPGGFTCTSCSTCVVHKCQLGLTVKITTKCFAFVCVHMYKSSSNH